jgi:tRNA threonylcarbamoyladenosine biosynthesis protein TsaB
MITLGMDCATDTVGLALLEGEEVRGEMHLGPGRHHAEVLLPALSNLLELTGMAMERIDLIACTAGPGSFTGVRMGVTTAKGLAMAAAKPIVGVSTLAALAVNGLDSQGLVCPLLDARRDQVYAGLYRMGPDGFPESILPDRLTDIAAWMADLPRDGITWVGDGAVRNRERIRQRPGWQCDPTQSPRHRISGRAVAILGIRDHGRGCIEDALTFGPRYLRLSEAEVKVVSDPGKESGGRETKVDILSKLR